MFGDDRQLGPVITEDALKNSPLAISMFERLLQKKTFEKSSVCLVQNYRSVPGVMAVFNRLFYGNYLVAMVRRWRWRRTVCGKVFNIFLPPSSFISRSI